MVRSTEIAEIAMALALVRTALLLFALFAWPNIGQSGAPDWPDNLIIGTASPGGTYDVYGRGLATILSRKLGLNVSTRATQGPIDNIKLLEVGEIQMAFVTLGLAQQGWNNAAAWTDGKQLREMRAIFPMYDTPFQFVVLENSKFERISDLAGKRIGIGPRGGTAGYYSPDFFKILGLNSTFTTGEWTDLVTQLQTRTLDALVVAAGVPVPEFLEPRITGQLRFLALAPSQIVDLRLAIPELSKSVVASGTYPTLLRQYQTIGLFNFAVVSQSLPDDLVYAIVDAVFTNQDQLMAVHAAAAETIPTNFSKNNVLPFHPGAMRWYHNKAVDGIVGGD